MSKPTWARFIARSMNGEWFYFENRPLLNDNKWTCVGQHAPAPGQMLDNVAWFSSCRELNTAEYTGKSVSYYRVSVQHPTSPDLKPYDAECNDIIEALGMDFAEGNAFKAIWRRCAARTLGKTKRGYSDDLYDAEKVVFFGQRMVVKAGGAA